MAAPTQPSTSHAHYSAKIKAKSASTMCTSNLTAMLCCQERNNTEQVQAQNPRLQVETGFCPSIWG